MKNISFKLYSFTFSKSPNGLYSLDNLHINTRIPGTFLVFPISLAFRDLSLETNVGHRSSKALECGLRRPNTLLITVPRAAAVVKRRASTTSLSMSSLETNARRQLL